MEFEPVIGLEIHVQLNTRSKMFSPAPNRFGDEPNTNVSYADTAQPGSLPVINREAVEKALLFGLAIDADISPESRFDRKSYFYPDSPRNFQITQFSHPIIRRGSLAASVDGVKKLFTIHHAHLEDDAGMLKHFSHFAGVDYNRAGVPLLEIVSDPCIRSGKEASAYAMAVRAIMEYIGASDGNMEEGSLRIDVNVSIRPKGSSELRNKIEIKNLNSFAHMEGAIEAEIRRQTAFYTQHPDQEIQSATYRFDVEKGETILMRTKEMAADYRYFPEPDLPAIRVSEEMLEKLRRNLPELPQQRFDRYTSDLGISPYSAEILTSDKALSDFFEVGLHTTPHAKQLCNWITAEFTGRFKEKGVSLLSSGVSASHIASLVNMIEEKTITGKIAKSIADLMAAHPEKSPQEILAENPDFQPLQDVAALQEIVDATLRDNPDSIASYKAGHPRAFQSLVGQVMKATRGKADPAVVNDLLKKGLS